ncbi:coatamer subunit beta [Theileria orientalis]|uniref:Coatamer subunit beta n=1 Tax=Theileria orientalis TaxID=68886 RepID=A0A976MA83_THEOR|nr:coatamer subunit beta [Theileria orientalis]
MDKQESDCPIYIDLDTSHLGSLNSIRKNLEDNKLSRKVKAMEDLLLFHLRGDDVSGFLMDIIRFIVPNNNHRIKRLVYLFFHTFNMNKPDGTPRDELILVCNALRNDLCSPNEFIRGAVLRLISRLNVFGLIQPLIPSIIDNIEHREPYVYRNALLCLTNISDYFGSDLITSSFKSVENFITSSDDVFGTVRAYKLLESCNLDLCIQFIIAIERNLLNLSPVVHLAILGSFDRFSSLNEDVAQMMARILFLLLQFSNDNSVLFYCSNLLLKYPHLNQMNVCCKSLIKVLLNESDLNVKIIIIDKLNMIQSSSRTANRIVRSKQSSSSQLANKQDNVLENYVNDLLKGLSVSNLVITRKLLNLILKVTTKSNVESILTSLVKCFVKVDLNYSSDEIAKYRSLLVKSLFRLTRSYVVYVLSVLGGMLVYLTDANEMIAHQVSLLFYYVLSTTTSTVSGGVTVDKRQEIVNKLLDQLVQNLNNIVSKEVLSNCLYIVGEYSNNYNVVNQLYELVTTTTENTSSRGAYNVILEDGSYSTNYTVGTTEVGLYKLLSKNRDILLFNTFSMTLLKLVHRSFSSKDQGFGEVNGAVTNGTLTNGTTTNGTLTNGTTTNGTAGTSSHTGLASVSAGKNMVEHSCLIIIKLINMVDKDVCCLKRLKMALLLLLGLIKERERYLKLIGTYLALCASNDRMLVTGKLSEATSAGTVGSEPFDVDIDLDDFFDSSATASSTESALGAAPTALGGRMETVESTIEGLPTGSDGVSDGMDTSETLDGGADVLGTYSKTHQFTSLTDPIYVEGFVKLIGNKLYFYLFLENKTKDVLQNISLDLSTGSELELITPKKMITLLPNTVKKMVMKFRIVGTGDTTLFGYVYFSFSNTIVLQCLTFNPINVSLYEFIKPSVIPAALFRKNWDQFEWEHKINLTGVKVSPSELLEVIARFTNMAVVDSTNRSGMLGGMEEFEDLETREGLGGSSGLEERMPGLGGGYDLSKGNNVNVLVNNSFFSINLFLKTLFDEEAIANLSLVKKENETYAGCFRIRSRKQIVVWNYLRMFRSRWCCRLERNKFGNLLPPRDKADKIKHQQVLDKIPYDLADGWFERNEILLEKTLKIMPKQFAESYLKYNKSDVDVILDRLLRYCVDSGHNITKMEDIIDKNSFMYNISQQIEEKIDSLNGSDCGIILKCFGKLNYGNTELTVKLLERLLNRLLSRGEQFSKYGVLYGLTAVVNRLDSASSSFSNGTENKNCSTGKATLSRMFKRLFGLAMDNLDKFDLNVISQLVNIISRSSLRVDKEMNKISDYVLENYGTSSGNHNYTSNSDKLWTENVIYYLANGFSRKSVLRKPLFDLFSHQMLKEDQYLTYGVDSLVSICNSFSKFGNVIDSGYLDLYAKIADLLVTKAGKLNSVHVSVLANAYCRVCVCHEALLRALLSRFMLENTLCNNKGGSVEVGYSPRQVAMILHSVVKLGYKCASLGYLFDQATKNLNSYCWQSLTMLFQSYCKSDYISREITDSFVDRFYKLLVETTSGNGTVNNNGIREGYGKTTLLSLVYSLVKTNTLYHVELMELISTEIKKCIECYSGDEVVNLVYSYCKIYKYSKTNQLGGLENVSMDILRVLMGQIKENQFNAFSMVKIVKSFGDVRLVEASEVILNLVKRNIQLIDKLSYQQVNTIIFAFSVLGINDMDLATVLNTIKYQKKIPYTPIP